MTGNSPKQIISPLISVIVPVWNGERYLKQLVESINTQQVKDIEVIFIDDGSTDGTEQLIQEVAPNSYYFRKEHSGTADTMNCGLEKARGKLIAFVDADDWWSADSLSLRLQAMQNGSVPIAGGQVQQFYSPELLPEISQRLHCPSAPQPGYVPGALLIQREVFDQVGDFSRQFQSTPGVDWVIRARDAGIPFLMLPQVVLNRRLHDQNISHRKQLRQDFTSILRHSLKRRRQALTSDRLPE